MLLPRHHNHAMILAAMASFYLSDPQAATADARLAKNQVLATMGGLAAPTMLVMRARRAANLLSADRTARGEPHSSDRQRDQKLDKSPDTRDPPYQPRE
jgi:hypothetical protein